MWELIIHPVNSCPSSDLCHYTSFSSSVYTCNRINNQEDGAKKFRKFKTGAENEGKGRKSLAVSEPQQGTGKTHILHPKDDSSLYSWWGKKYSLAGCKGLKLQMRATVQKMRSMRERRQNNLKREKKKGKQIHHTLTHRHIYLGKSMAKRKGSFHQEGLCASETHGCSQKRIQNTSIQEGQGVLKIHKHLQEPWGCNNMPAVRNI